MKPDKHKLEKAAFILKTIAHPTRLAVIGELQSHPELTVNELVERTGCEQSLLSHHLINMKIKGLLEVRKEGTSAYYKLKEKNLSNVLECIDKCDCQM
jgi:DNA-binding transcriptional ArsR family regulator